MTRALLLGALLGLVGVANAEPGDADAYAKHSTTLFLGNQWSPGPTVPIRVGADATLRFHRHHVAIEARLGFGGVGTLTGFASQFGGHFGASIGFAVSPARRIVLAPMLAYDVFGLWEQGGATFAVHYATVEVPLTIVIARHVVLEPYVQLGIARFHGATDPAIIFGPRIGIVF